jgi:hypothetical protein
MVTGEAGAGFAEGSAGAASADGGATAAAGSAGGFGLGFAAAGAWAFLTGAVARGAQRPGTTEPSVCFISATQAHFFFCSRQPVSC